MMHAGMTRVGSAVDSLRLCSSMRFPDFVHVQRREHHAFGIAKSDGGSCSNGSCSLIRNIEDNGNRPDLPIGQPHSAGGTFVIGTRHESAKRREATVQE